MLRFAFTPTDDMHIGHLRIALLNALAAKLKNEDFIVRVEDRDKKEGVDQEFLDLLTLFNIEYSQVIYQSQNFKFHSAMALQLLHEKKAFACFCSDEWLAKKRQEAKDADIEYCYDDACRNLPAELVIDNTAPFTVRIVRPDREIVIKDSLKGELHFDAKSVDSFVILHQDKTSTDTFASAVDDMLSDVSLVIRDDAFVPSAPKEVHIREQLGYNKEVEYAHLPPLENAQEFTIKELLKEGYLPEAISNYLISITLKQPLEEFSLEAIKNEPTIFDIEALKEENKKHMKKMDPLELSRYVGFADAEIGELAKLYVDEAPTTRKLKEKIAPIFEARTLNDSSDLQQLKEKIANAPYFEEYDAFKNHLLKEIAMQEDELEKGVRLILTNSQEGPDIKDIYKYLKNYIGGIVK